MQGFFQVLKKGGGGVCHSQAKIFDLKFSIIYKRIKLQHDAQISWAESCRHLVNLPTCPALLKPQGMKTLRTCIFVNYLNLTFLLSLIYQLINLYKIIYSYAYLLHRRKVK